MKLSDIHKLRLEARADRACGFIFTGEPELDAVPVTPEPRFPMVSCSQCGADFGPGDNGFSHCRDHRHLIGVTT